MQSSAPSPAQSPANQPAQPPARRALRILTAGLAAAGLGGCGAATAALDAGRALEARAAALTVGADPAPARPLADRPLAEIGRYARFGSAWHRYEFARRLEFGVGVPRDPACAVYWYDRAGATPRPPGRPYATEPLGAGETGIWQARIAVERLSAKDAAARDAVRTDSPRFGEASARCAALVFDNPAYAAPPPPSW